MGPTPLLFTVDKRPDWFVEVPLPITLDAKQSTPVVVSVTVGPEAISGTMDTTVVTATSGADSRRMAAAVTDTTTVERIYGVDVAPDWVDGGYPGDVVVDVNTVANLGNYADTFNLEYESSQEWIDGTPSASVSVSAWSTKTVEVSIKIPVAATSGMVDTTVITATSTAAPGEVDTAVDTTLVGPYRMSSWLRASKPAPIRIRKSSMSTR